MPRVDNAPLEEWIILKLQDGDSLPVVDSIEIGVSEVVEV